MKLGRSGLVDFFPILASKVRGKDLVYLDSGATSLKPQPVLQAMNDYYLNNAASVHRGAHYLSDLATEKFEGVRAKVAKFIGARSSHEIIFTSGTTHAINIVAQSFGSQLSAGDEIILSEMEHHSNIVPWQLLRERSGIVLRVIPVNDLGELDLEKFRALITERTRLISVVHVSNSLGTINPIAKISRIARERKIPMLVDAAQSVPHLAVDVAALGCDFLVFSAHKMFGPNGVGVLYMKEDLVKRLPPALGGGHMIRQVSFAKTTFAESESKFEPGTPNIAGVIGLGAAIDFVTGIGYVAIARHEHELLGYALERMRKIEGIRLIGDAGERAALISFLYRDVHAHDIGSILDIAGIAVRAGHHCCQPVMERFGVAATARASFSIYNSREDVDILIEAIKEVGKVFA